MVTIPEDFLLTSYHEAGHAVAVVMRGHALREITVRATEQHRGFTGYRGTPFDAAFIAWAGPWAQARASWAVEGGLEPVTLAACDEEGVEFAGYIFAAFLTGGDDDDNVVDAHFIQLRRLGVDVDITVTYGVWCYELEQVWPVIREVAGRLLRGESVNHGLVATLLNEADTQP